jgi:hypothetical protein
MSSDSEEYILILPRTYFGSSWNPEIFLFSVFFVSYKNAVQNSRTISTKFLCQNLQNGLEGQQVLLAPFQGS